jgi:hypothetical protein
VKEDSFIWKIRLNSVPLRSPVTTISPLGVWMLIVNDSALFIALFDAPDVDRQ